VPAECNVRRQQEQVATCCYIGLLIQVVHRGPPELATENLSNLFIHPSIHSFINCCLINSFTSPNFCVFKESYIEFVGGTDQVDDDILGPSGSPLGRYLADVHHGLGLVGVHVEDWRVDHTSHVRAVRRRTTELRRRREPDLQQRVTPTLPFTQQLQLTKLVTISK